MLSKLKKVFFIVTFALIIDCLPALALAEDMAKLLFIRPVDLMIVVQALNCHR